MRLLLADCVCIEKENERVAVLFVKAELFYHPALKRPKNLYIKLVKLKQQC